MKTPELNPLMSSSSPSISIKPKLITSSNGSPVSYSRHSENSSTSLEYVSPTKKASDHSISQLIACPPTNHTTLTAALLHSTQALQQSYADSPTTSSSSHSVSNKVTPGASSKPKSDTHHRQSQSTPNGSNNNNFLHNNNNSKQTAPRASDTATVIDLCDTDDGESTAKKPKPHKHKHNKKSKDIERNAVSLPLPNSVHLINQLQQTASMGQNAVLSADVDHNQIINDLKVNRSFLRKYFDLQL